MRLNNFDFLRFLFALLVVISHSYPLSGGNVSSEWIYQLTNGQIELSGIGLNGFFTLSGFLIFKSLERSRSLFEFYWKRILRIFPALVVVLILTVLLMSFVYENRLPYYKNISIYTYFIRNLTLYNLQYGIDGVFNNNIYPKAINGSLWTIWYEFSLYIALSTLFFLKKSKIFLKGLVLIVFIIMYLCYNFFLDRFGIITIFGLQGVHFLNLGTYFVCGSLLAVFKIETKVKHNRILIFLILLFLISLHFNIYTYVKHIFFPAIILFIGLKPINYIRSFGVKGDFSYGIYI
jgi:peptidoglycan/LPS O-acetylase OafA/YrhL